jgi:hypothetical protein
MRDNELTRSIEKTLRQQEKKENLCFSCKRKCDQRITIDLPGWGVRVCYKL